MSDDDISIVVVDDDPSIAMLIESSLCQFSRNVSVFLDCWSAWMHIKNNPTDLVISDIHMNGMNGLDLLRSVKRFFPQIGCIMISGDYSLEASLMEMGADAFLRKPIRISTLLGKVKDFSRLNGEGSPSASLALHGL